MQYAIRNTRWVRALLAIAAVYAVICLALMLNNAATNPLGGIDFHSYWYAAHFLREGRDPYEASLRGATPTPPIHYLDGATVNGDPAQPKLQKVPANTAPLLLLLAPFSFLSWGWAKDGWMVLNTLFMLIAPWLTFRLAAQHDIKLSRTGQFAVALAFYTFASSRYVVGYGQTSIVVYLLMILALLRVKAHPIEAGLWAGIALSKYSMAFPLLLLFAFWRQWKTIGVALLVQAGGVLAISAIGGNSPLEVVQWYAQYATGHADFSGVHLAALFKADSIFRIIAPVAVTVAVGVVLWVRGIAQRTPLQEKSDFALIALALVWGLLVVYHRMYDAGLVLPTLLLIVWWAEQHTGVQRWRWMGYGIAVVTILALPVPPYEWIFKQYWGKVFNSVWTLLFMTMLVVSLGAWRQLHQQTSANHKLQMAEEISA